MGRGWNANHESDLQTWNTRVAAFLASALGQHEAQAFLALRTDRPDSHYYWEEDRERQIGHLEGLALRVGENGLGSVLPSIPQTNGPKLEGNATQRVFVVHGHDHGTKESIARFLEKLGLEPIILHEKANAGRTIIEKFEAFSNVGFAVALLTPDDVGSAVDQQDSLNARARQNVVLELGYFTGRLGRNRVCGLFKNGLEIPSDFHGVLFIELDEQGAWRTKLAQELIQAGMQINLQALVNA